MSLCDFKCCRTNECIPWLQEKSTIALERPGAKNRHPRRQALNEGDPWMAIRMNVAFGQGKES